MSEICLKLKIKAPERCHCIRSGVFIGNFELIPRIDLVFLLLILNNSTNMTKMKIKKFFGKEYISNENLKAEQKRRNKVFSFCFLSKREMCNRK